MVKWVKDNNVEITFDGERYVQCRVESFKKIVDVLESDFKFMNITNNDNQNIVTIRIDKIVYIRYKFGDKE